MTKRKVCTGIVVMLWCATFGFVAMAIFGESLNVRAAGVAVGSMLGVASLFLTFALGLDWYEGLPE